jgi:hypothetical protein
MRVHHTTVVIGCLFHKGSHWATAIAAPWRTPSTPPRGARACAPPTHTRPAFSTNPYPLRLITQEVSTSEPVMAAAAASTSAASVQSFSVMNPVTEAINGRAAMLGFVAAVASESVTHQAVWSQIVGRYIDLQIVEAPIGAAPLGFAMVVALTTMASLAPKMLEGADVDSKSIGPFTPGLELTLGRVAQLGFLGLVFVELLKGSSLL